MYIASDHVMYIASDHVMYIASDHVMYIASYTDRLVACVQIFEVGKLWKSFINAYIVSRGDVMHVWCNARTCMCIINYW